MAHRLLVDPSLVFGKEEGDLLLDGEAAGGGGGGGLREAGDDRRGRGGEPGERGGGVWALRLRADGVLRGAADARGGGAAGRWGDARELRLDGLQGGALKGERGGKEGRGHSAGDWETGSASGGAAGRAAGTGADGLRCQSRSEGCRGGARRAEAGSRFVFDGELLGWLGGGEPRGTSAD